MGSCVLTCLRRAQGETSDPADTAEGLSAPAVGWALWSAQRIGSSPCPLLH